MNTVTQPKGGQFVLHVRSRDGDPFDGHVLAAIADIQTISGVEVRHIHIDMGYRGHDYTDRFRVWIRARSAAMTATIRSCPGWRCFCAP